MKLYRKSLLQPMRPYVMGEDMSKVSITYGDELEEGGMIATNPKDPLDMWYIAKDFFEENYEEVPGEKWVKVIGNARVVL